MLVNVCTCGQFKLCIIKPINCHYCITNATHLDKKKKKTNRDFHRLFDIITVATKNVHYQ